MSLRVVSKDIDPGRDTLGKGILSATGGYGCERERYYGERVRLPNGWRLRFPMPERVHFGSAIDTAHSVIVGALVRGEDITERTIAFAVDAGFEDGTKSEWSELRDDDVFRTRIANAVHLLLRPDPEGHRPVDDLPLDGIHIQGIDGESLRIPEGFGDRDLGATPDYLWTEDGMATAWLDVKARGRASSWPAQWLKAEPCIYTLALTLHNGGIPPQWIAYQEYIRVTKPYWITTRRDVTPDLMALARHYINRWTTALDADNPDGLSFDASLCGKCDFREAIPAANYPGCPIGAASIGIAGGLT